MEYLSLFAFALFGQFGPAGIIAALAACVPLGLLLGVLMLVRRAFTR
jgi:hypothetical protein